MRIWWLAAMLAVCTLAACSGRGTFFRAYEYEEDMYLSLDGSATVYVNSSIPALNALRGTSFDVDPATEPDRDAVRAYFSTAGAQVTRVTVSRRRNRRFVHVRMDVPSVERLSKTPPFAWSKYSFGRQGDLFAFKQEVGAPARRPGASVEWEGDELVAFRLHLPSKIVYHNGGPGNPRRGNILAWEQPLSSRLRGEPLVLDARMATESILYRTLALFGVTFLAAAVFLAGLVWWVVRRGRRPAQV
ncbi:MAG: hypothetical protein AB7Q29_14290 [Vicinamibacterales bacterium]